MASPKRTKRSILDELSVQGSQPLDHISTPLILQDLPSSSLGEQDLPATLAKVARRAIELVRSENASVVLTDWDLRQVRFVQSCGKHADDVVGLSFGLDGSAVGWVATTGRAAVFNNMQADERADVQMTRQWGVNAAVMAPMKLGGRVIGVLAAYNRIDRKPFSEDDLGVFSALASQAAFAIGNAQLYAEMREALQKADAERIKLEVVLNNLGDGVVVSDADGRVILANESAELITGISRKDVIGRAPTCVLPRIYAAEVAAAVRSLANTRREDGMFREMIIKLGTGKTVRVNIHPVFATDGSFFGTAAVLQDITKAVQIDRAKTEFISTVAHELRTPLTALKGSIGLVLGGAAGEVPDPLRDLLGIAQNNCNRLIRLVDDMLDIAKIEADRFSLCLEVAPVQDCVRRAVGQMQQIADEREVRLNLRLIGKPPMVVIDRDRIEQVVTNLLSNAIKFSSSSGEIVVLVKRVHGYVLVSVTDRGCGIPREDQQKVFEKFYQGGGPARRNGGSGLGLAISKAIVEQHGGKIYVKSTPGQGSTFAFLVPVPGEEALMTVQD